MHIPRPPACPFRVFHISRVWGSRHGGSYYSQALAEELSARGCEVTLLAEQFSNAQSAFRQIRLTGFFRRDLCSWPKRVRDMFVIWRLVMSLPRAMVIVQGDLPRVSYLLLQLVVPLWFIRQDGILTCPGNNRFLARSRTVCGRRMGLGCLAMHRAEGCMHGLSWWRQLARLLLRCRDGLLLRCIAQFVTSSRYLARVHGRPARVIYPPIGKAAPGQRSAPSLPEASVRPTERWLRRMVFCGRLEQVKGAADAVTILSLLPEEYCLEVLGDGVERERLHRLVGELGLKERVRFYGWVDGSERDRLMSGAGVLVMPSLWDEGFGMAGVEAMSVGTPVVAYDVGGISEWCRGEGGVLVRCGDVEGAAAAVLRLTEEPGRWAAYSRAARQWAEEKFGPGRFGEKVQQLL